MNGQLESWASEWVQVLWHASLYGGLAIVVAMAVVMALHRFKLPAWAEHWIWKLVFVKLLLALVITQPIQLPVLPPDVTPSPSNAATVPSPTGTVITDEISGPISPANATADFSNLKANFNSTSSQWTWTANWPVIVLAIWVAGVAINLFFLLKQWVSVIRLKIVPVHDVAIGEIVSEIAQAKRLPRVPRLATSDQLEGPALVGWFRPAIVFPPEMLQQCSSQQLRGVLGHELEHFRRGDLWWNLLPATAQLLFFFHPLVWLARHRWRLSSEMACDAQAIEDSAGSVAEYAESLLRMAQLGSQRQSQHCLGSVAVFGSSRSLKQRLFAMKDYQADSTGKVMFLAACLALAGLLGILPWQLTSRAADREDANTADQQVDDSNNFGKNMDFEEKAESGDYAKYWGGGGNDCKLTLDNNKPQSGKSCGRIQSKTGRRFGTYTQCIDAADLRGKRIRLTGYLRTDVEGNGGLWMRVDAGKQTVGFDNTHDRRIEGKTDWKKQNIVLDVPDEATGICFGFMLVGRGDVWGDNLKLAVVGDAGSGPQITGRPVEDLSPAKEGVNLDFEQVADHGVKGWGGGGEGYEQLRDATTKHSGKASARLRRTGDGGQFGAFTQMISAEKFRGKRVRYSGFLKTTDAEKAGLWMRVDGAKNEVLAFDNMNPRAVSGTTDWAEYEIILDVADKARAVTFGFLLIGSGTVWGDDLSIEAVGPAGKGPKTTEMSSEQPRGQFKYPKQFRNGDFEQPRGDLAQHWGGGGQGYQLTRDEQEKHAGSASGKIEQQDDSGNFGTFTQMFVPEKYRGKRVRLTGFLKTKDAKSAGLWMRIDGPSRPPLGFDNMQTRPVTGTTDWKEYSVVLDVPDVATHIALGFLISGPGTVWGDDLKLEIVGELGQGPPSTNMLQTGKGTPK